MFNEFGFLACKTTATGGQKNEQRASRDGDFLRQSAEANADQTRARDKLKSIRSPLVDSHRAISSEYKIPIFEVVKKNNRIKDTIPVHCRIDLK